MSFGKALSWHFFYEDSKWFALSLFHLCRELQNICLHLCTSNLSKLRKKRFLHKNVPLMQYFLFTTRMVFFYYCERPFYLLGIEAPASNANDVLLISFKHVQTIEIKGDLPPFYYIQKRLLCEKPINPFSVNTAFAHFILMVFGILYFS